MTGRIKSIGQVRYFLITVLISALVLGIILLSSDKTSSHLAINNQHNSFWDFFFKYLTYLGDGVFVAIGILVIGILGYKKWKWRFFAYGWGLLMLTGMLAQFFKRVVFPDSLRPSAYLSENTLHLIEGVQMHHHHSFPSGHTTAAFAFFGFVALYCFDKKPILQVACALLALLIGFSRVYLSQHFMEDVLAGMLLGTFGVLCVSMIDSSRT